MRYTTRELRLFDLFALLLAGLGILFLMIGAVHLATAGPGIVIFSNRPGKGGAKAVKGVAGASRAWAPFFMGTALLALGVALGAGVRKVARNGGDDPADGRVRALPAPDDGGR